MPETRARSSTVVHSAKNAKQLGKPNPIDMPKATLRVKKNIESICWISIRKMFVNNPRNIHDIKNFFRLTLSLIMLLTIAENTATPRKM
jgi:hypothetical protein